VIDRSSLSNSNVEKATAPVDEHFGKAILEGMVECNIAVYMPPKKRYSIELDIKSIKKAKPKVVEPELI